MVGSYQRTGRREGVSLRKAGKGGEGLGKEYGTSAGVKQDGGGGGGGLLPPSPAKRSAYRRASVQEKYSLWT